MKVLIKEKLSQHRYKDNHGYLICTVCTDCIMARTGNRLTQEMNALVMETTPRLKLTEKKQMCSMTRHLLHLRMFLS